MTSCLQLLTLLRSSAWYQLAPIYTLENQLKIIIDLLDSQTLVYQKPTGQILNHYADFLWLLMNRFGIDARRQHTICHSISEQHQLADTDRYLSNEHENIKTGCNQMLKIALKVHRRCSPLSSFRFIWTRNLWWKKKTIGMTWWAVTNQIKLVQHDVKWALFPFQQHGAFMFLLFLGWWWILLFVDPSGKTDFTGCYITFPDVEPAERMIAPLFVRVCVGNVNV